MKILICGVRAPIAFDLIKSFMQYDCQLHIADCFIPFLLRNIICSKNQHIYSPPAEKYQDFAKDSQEIINIIKPDLVICLNEEIFYFAKLRQEFEYNLFAPKLELLLKLHSKLEFIEFAQTLGLKAPQTKIATINDDYRNLVFKNNYSRFGENIKIRPQNAPKIIPSHNPLLAQEFIEGIDYSFYAIAHNGEICAFACYKSDWRTKGGAAYYFTPAPDDIYQKAKKIAKKIAISTHYNGHFSCDFRLYNSQEIYLIECNPRATSGLHTLYDGTENLALAFIENKNLKAMATPKYLGVAMIIFGLPKALLGFNIRKYLYDLKAGTNIFKRHNIAIIIDSMHYLWRAFWAKKSLSQIMTSDIECNRNINEN